MVLGFSTLFLPTFCNTFKSIAFEKAQIVLQIHCMPVQYSLHCRPSICRLWTKLRSSAYLSTPTSAPVLVSSPPPPSPGAALREL